MNRLHPLGDINVPNTFVCHDVADYHRQTKSAPNIKPELTHLFHPPTSVTYFIFITSFTKAQSPLNRLQLSSRMPKIPHPDDVPKFIRGTVTSAFQNLNTVNPSSPVTNPTTSTRTQPDSPKAEAPLRGGNRRRRANPSTAQNSKLSTVRKVKKAAFAVTFLMRGICRLKASRRWRDT